MRELLWEESCLPLFELEISGEKQDSMLVTSGEAPSRWEVLEAEDRTAE